MIVVTGPNPRCRSLQSCQKLELHAVACTTKRINMKGKKGQEALRLICVPNKMLMKIGIEAKSKKKRKLKLKYRKCFHMKII